MEGEREDGQEMQRVVRRGGEEIRGDRERWREGDKDREEAI